MGIIEIRLSASVDFLIWLLNFLRSPLLGYRPVVKMYNNL